MTEDSFEYQLTPIEEDRQEVVYDEPFVPGTVLVPVRCTTCHLLQYTRETNVGKWLVCPDCDRKNEIRAVAQTEKVVVELSEEGTFEMRPVAAKRVSAPKFNVDWRQVPDAVDVGAEAIPYQFKPDRSDDHLENLFDRMLKPAPTGSKRESVSPAPAENQRVSPPAPSGPVNAGPGTGLFVCLPGGLPAREQDCGGRQRKSLAGPKLLLSLSRPEQ